MHGFWYCKATVQMSVYTQFSETVVAEALRFMDLEALQ